MKDKKNYSSKEQNDSKKIVIAERDNIGALMEGDKVLDLYINRGEVLLGDVYLATVQNVLPSIEAAFVDVGVDKMGFLHAQDVMGKGALKDKLAPNQKLVVQVVKEPTGHKGPRVTTEISLPGRFLVLMPSEPGINVSRKIESSKERARLKSIVSLLKPVGVGVIIRTEAEGQSEADIQEDLEILLEKWNNIVPAAESLTPPNLLYRDQDLLYRVIREACSEDVTEIIVDTAFALNRVQSLLQNWHMNKNINVTLYKGNEPLLIATNVHKEIKAALNMRVNMPSGGYLFIQQTEALTVIDVNSGKFVSSATQDETILKTNIEAVHEIARQLRLRNIGGMIIIDFIDMTSRVDKLAIMEELEIAIEDDKAKPQVGQLSDLGLVEMTRHRQGQAISEVFAKKCPHCHGEGYIIEDFKFASPTAEGEYRAKAAKMKLPISGFKKNNKNKQNNVQPQIQEIQEQPQAIEMTAQNPSVAAQEETKKRNSSKKTKLSKRINKKELQENATVKTAEILINADDEIIPIIEEQITEKVQENNLSENKPEQKTDLATETKPEAEINVEEQPKKTRRPNRGASKAKKATKPKTTRKTKTKVKTTKEENVE